MNDLFKIAVFTQVFNESLFLPIWLNHYGTLFGFENLIVIDEGSTDGSTLDSRIKNLLKKKPTPHNEIDRAVLISLFHRALLNLFDIVIYTDCDEPIVLDPKINSNLADYIKGIEGEWQSLIGFDCLHNRNTESALDLKKDLFEQRSFVRLSHSYCKTLVSKTEIEWKACLHTSDKRPSYDANLFLFHLRSIDYEYSRRRIRILNSLEHSLETLALNLSFQSRMTESEYLEYLYDAPNAGIEDAYEGELQDLFLESVANPDQDGRVARIPERFRHSIKLSSYAQILASPLEQCVHKNEKLLNLPNIELQKLFDECIEKMIASRKRSRDSICPCGSGRRLKHCHGKFEPQ